MSKRKPMGVSGKGMLSEEQTLCRLKYTESECRGTISRIEVSKMEESLGHRKYQCDKCAAMYKFGLKDSIVN